MKDINDSFANINIFPGKDLVVSSTSSLRFTAIDLIEADSWQLNSRTTFALFEFTVSSVLASISKNFLFSQFLFQPGL